MVCNAKISIGRRYPNRVRITLWYGPDANDRMTKSLEGRHRFRVPLRRFKGYLIGKPLVRKSWRLDCDGKRYFVVECTDQKAQERVGNGLAARASGNQHDTAIFSDDRGHLRTQWRLPGAIVLGAVPICPLVSVTPGKMLNARMSLLRMNPISLTTMRDPQMRSRV